MIRLFDETRELGGRDPIDTAVPGPPPPAIRAGLGLLVRTRVALGLRPVVAPALLFVPIGTLLGPRGLDLISFRVLAQRRPRRALDVGDSGFAGVRLAVRRALRALRAADRPRADARAGRPLRDPQRGRTGLHFEPVMALAAGLVVENIAPPQGDALRDAVERGALPVLIVFFAAAGASLRLDALSTFGLLAIAVALVRGAAIWAGGRLGTRISTVDAAHSGFVWMGLVSQAGVTLGLVFIVSAEFPPWGVHLQTFIVSMIALHQLVGPVLLRTALTRVGEVGRLDLDRRPAEAKAESAVT